LLIISLFNVESQNFVTMARKIVIVLNICDMSLPSKSVWYKIHSHILHSRATANFLFKNTHLVTIAEVGLHGVNFNGSVKLCIITP